MSHFPNLPSVTCATKVELKVCEGSDCGKLFVKSSTSKTRECAQCAHKRLRAMKLDGEWIQ